MKTKLIFIVVALFIMPMLDFSIENSSLPLLALTVPSTRPPTELMKAAENGDNEKIKELIQTGADVNERHWTGDTALFFATSNGHFETTKLLIDLGADVNVRGYFMCTALVGVSYNGDINIVQLLLENGAIDFDSIAFSVAKEKGHRKVAKLLKKYSKTNINEEIVKNDFSLTPDELFIIKLMLINNEIGDYSQINFLSDLNNKGFTQITRKVEKISPFSFDELKNRKLNIDDLSKESLAKLERILLKEYKEKVLKKEPTKLETLIEKHEDKEGIEQIKKLLKRGVSSIFAIDDEGKSALIIASNYGYIEIAEELIKNKAQIDIYDNNNKTALDYASLNGDVEMVKLLVKNNATIYDRTTLIKEVKSRGFTQITKLLEDRFLPYFTNNHILIVQLLLKSSNKTYTDEYVFVEDIKKRGYKKIAKIVENKLLPFFTLEELQNKQPNIAVLSKEELHKIELILEEYKDKSLDETLLKLNMALKEYKNIEEISQIKSLLKKGIDTQDEEGRTALIIASKYGYIDIAKLLINAGANIDIRDYNGASSASYYAITNGDIKMVKLLLENAEARPFASGGLIRAAKREGFSQIAELLQKEFPTPATNPYHLLIPASRAFSPDEYFMIQILLQNSGIVYEDIYDFIEGVENKGYLKIAKKLKNKASIYFTLEDINDKELNINFLSKETLEKLEVFLQREKSFIRHNLK